MYAQNSKAQRYFSETLELYRKGKYHEALKRCKKVVRFRLNPQARKDIKHFLNSYILRINQASILLTMGHIYGSLNAVPEAEKCFRKAIQLESKNPMCYYEYGKYYKDGNDNELALKNFMHAISLGLKKPRCYYEIGLIHSDNKRYDIAKMFFDMAVKMYKHKPYYYYELVIVCYELEKYNDALINLNHALKLELDYNADTIECLLYKAKSLIELDKAHLALEPLKKIKVLDVEEAECDELLGDYVYPALAEKEKEKHFKPW